MRKSPKVGTPSRSLDTNGNGKRDEYTEPNQPWIPPRTGGSALVSYGSPWRLGTVLCGHYPHISRLYRAH